MAKTAVVLELSHAGRVIRVDKNDGHPEQYLWVAVGSRRFFLGVLEPQMKRGDVKRLALRWVADHPEHFGGGIDR